MGHLKSKSGINLISFQTPQENLLRTPVQFNEYSVVLVNQGSGIFYSDFGAFSFQAPVILFATPLQLISIAASDQIGYDLLHFHGDFYCIEYHREEVACNGLLFNNIYIEPSLKLDNADYKVFQKLAGEIADELAFDSPSDIVLQSFLQLFLAKCSQIKTRSLETVLKTAPRDQQMERFKDLLEANFLTLRKTSHYADLLNMSANNLTKRCSKYFNKTPSDLIWERQILEAKKQLHLTRKSIKEIAYGLNFQDEFYFSRFFKKHTKESPQSFRDKTGISVVADLYRE